MMAICNYAGLMSKVMYNTHCMNVLKQAMTFEYSAYETLLALNGFQKFQFTQFRLRVLSILSKDLSIV